MSRRIPLACFFCVATLGIATLGEAGELGSSSYRQLGGHVSAGAVGVLQSASYSGGGSVGQATPIGFASASALLDTNAPGFWPIAEGALPSLDADGDGIAAFADPDDDNDLLPDVVETNTGIFVSPSNTGTSPVDADSDGDGIDDNDEVLQGSDPNDAGSPAPPMSIPSATPVGVALLAGLLAFTGFGRALAARRRR